MSYTRVKFEQTHIIRPASCGTFRRFAQTFLKRQPSQFLFWRTSPLCDTNAVYTRKPLLSSHFSVFCRNKFNFRFVFAHPAACSRLFAKYLIFLFCTFLFINPLCNLSIFTLVPGSVTFALPCRKKGRRTKCRAAALSFNYMLFTRPDNPAAVLRGWGGAACAAPLLRSAAPAPGSH